MVKDREDCIYIPINFMGLKVKMYRYRVNQ